MKIAVPRGILALAALATLAAAVPALSQAVPSATGIIAGRVILAETSEPLFGVEVKIEGTSFTTTTDRAGRFRLASVPVGERNVTVSSQGFAAVSGKVVVTAGGTVKFDATLKIPYTGEAVVTAPLERSQARALTVQANAPNILNVVAADEINALPDTNVAESAGRIAGVSLTIDDGEGENIVVRGLPPQLNSVTMNGERIPSTDSRNRSIDFVNTSSSILQSIEVTKAITPAMDADAIGGAVNLVTKQAPEQPLLLVSVGSEYMDQRDEFNGEANVTYGQRFADDKLGVVLSGSYEDHDRSNQTRDDIVWSGTTMIENVMRGEESNAERYSLNGAFDWVIGTKATAYLRGTWSGREQEKIRRRTRMRDIDKGVNGLNKGRLQFEIRNRERTVDTGGFSAGGSFTLSDTLVMDYAANYAIGQREEPNTISTVYRQSNVGFTTPQVDGYEVFVSPTNQDYAKATLNQVQLLNLDTKDEDIVGRLDFKSFLNGGTTLSYGVKYRTKDKSNDENTTNYTGTAPNYAAVVEPEIYHIYDDKYGVLGQYPNKNKGLELIANYNLKGAKDYLVDTADYTADEDVLAGFLQAEFALGKKLTALAGARYEYTSSEYVGTGVNFDSKGAYIGTVAIPGEKTYGNFLPGLHLRWAFNDKANLRLAATTSLARPVFYDMVPRQSVSEQNDQIDRGNPDLDVTSALNLDLLYEHYFASIGVVSGGFFYKDIKDPIVSVQFIESIGGDPYRVTQPINGQSASIMGFEVAFSKQFRSLPAPFDGLGVNLNYTFADGDLTLGDGRKTRFFLQPEHTANAALSYEKRGFSGRIAYKYVGDFIEQYGTAESEDLYIDSHSQWDLSLNQKIGKHLSVYLNLVNANDEPWRRFYGGDTFRAAWYETYSWWGAFGIRYNFY